MLCFSEEACCNRFGVLEFTVINTYADTIHLNTFSLVKREDTRTLLHCLRKKYNSENPIHPMHIFVVPAQFVLCLEYAGGRGDLKVTSRLDLGE